MARKDPMDEVRRILAEMKANGVTISTTPAPGREADFRERVAGIIHREAQELGMTYGDRAPGDTGNAAAYVAMGRDEEGQGNE